MKTRKIYVLTYEDNTLQGYIYYTSYRAAAEQKEKQENYEKVKISIVELENLGRSI